MSVFLGVDGGGTKTEFVLIDSSGSVLATHREGSAYHLEIGIQSLRSMLENSVSEMLTGLSLAPADLSFAVLGLPAYGENSKLLPQLDHILDTVLPKTRYHCANDVVCGWAGALAGGDGVAVVAGTGSMAYGQYDSRCARAGGWGELFGDEGSAFWIAREALTVFSRMSDGRMPRGALHQLILDHFGASSDFDVCATLYGPPALSRSEIAGLSPRVTQAARAGDAAAMRIFESAARELAALAHAVHDVLQAPDHHRMQVSYCGGLMQPDGLLLPLFEHALQATQRRYEVVAPRLPPGIGAAVLAARLAGAPLADMALRQLSGTAKDRSPH